MKPTTPRTICLSTPAGHPIGFLVRGLLAAPARHGPILPRIMTVAILCFAPTVVESFGGEVARANDALVMVNGDVRSANLSRIDPNWSMTFGDDSGTRRVDGSEVLRWGAFREPPQQPQVLLANRGLILANDPVAPSYGIELTGEQIVVHNRTLGRLELPRAAVCGILLKPPASVERYDRLVERVRVSAANIDSIWLDNEDDVVGRVESCGNDNVRLVHDGRPIEIPMSRVSVIHFGTTEPNEPDAGRDGLRAIVGFRDGSRLTLRSWESELRRLRLDDSTGYNIELPANQAVERFLSAVQMLGGAFDYLSDLEPLAYKHIPYLDISSPLGVERTPSGRALRCRGVPYWKGVSMRSQSRVAFDLAGRYDRFFADLALDDESGGGGSVVFRVLLQSETNAWREAYRSDVVRGHQQPLSISVDVASARYLALLVEYADRADQSDIADWLDARLTRSHGVSVSPGL